MGLPGSVVPNGDDWIVRELRELRKMIEGNAAARSAESTAIGAGGIQSSDFDGTDPSDPGTAGFKLGRVVGGESFLILDGIDVYADLAAKQTALSDQVAAIAALVAAQVDGDTYTNSYGPAPVTAGSDYAAVTPTVPAGYTKAVIMAVSNVAVGGAPPILTVAVNVNGALGFALPVGDTSGSDGDGGASHATVLTGLTGGSTFSVSTRVVTKTGATGSTYITTTAIVMWLK